MQNQRGKEEHIAVVRVVLFKERIHQRYDFSTIKGGVILTNTIGQKSAKIKVKTMIWNNGEEETFELTTFGRYYEKGDSSYLQYEELLEEDTVKSIVKVSEDEVLILRSGAVNMRMVFSAGDKHTGRYETSYGVMGVETITKKLAHKLEEHRGSIDVLYELHMQGALAGTYQLEISFEEEKK